MAPDVRRARPRTSNASFPSSSAARRPRNSKARQSIAGTANKATKQKQSSLRESWAAPSSSRRQQRDEEAVSDDEEDAGPARRPRPADENTSRPNPPRGAPASNSNRIIGRRGIPQANIQPGEQQRRDDEPESDDNRASSAPPSPPKPYVHVAPHTRRVRQSAIEAKWSPLAEASLAAISTTLQHAQRPILQRLSDSPLRRTHTSSALRLISHRISRKMARGLPFPPASMPAPVGRAPLQSDAGREVELNFESVLDGKLNLQRQLEPALDGLEVLRREKDNMEDELEQDYETLRNLEAGARAQAREQRSLLKKAHVLTPAAKSSHHVDGDDDEFRFIRHHESLSAGGAFTTIRDNDEIQPLAVQLGHHVDSIRANLAQTDGILPQLAKSRAALRAVLLSYLDLRQYEQVVLG